jgi:predicted DNA-binding transcriptional regulator YafY
MLIKYFNRLESLDHLVRIKGTGSPKQLARRLNISERSIYEYLELLRTLGAPIRYCKFRKSYYYEDEGILNLKFLKKAG